ncbi:hypothetical protein [Acidiplasma cupricumulans]|uniref:hypothetical protein n=1 Tax=Acidiplasma cupricumulans TaxID=312540 RepID=UPI00191C1EF4|nr:hypothetical protein [Acidiplasma cupricumulans]
MLWGILEVSDKIPENRKPPIAYDAAINAMIKDVAEPLALVGNDSDAYINPTDANVPLLKKYKNMYGINME